MPNNNTHTGIDWWDAINMSGHGEPESSAFTACFGKELEQSDFEAICEWAVQTFLSRTPAEPKAQRQDALRYQLEDLLKMAVREGMYDAHQFIADCMAARPIEMNLVDLEMELDAAARPATDYNSRVRAISVDTARVILRRAFAAAAPRIRSEIVSQVMGPMYEDGRLPLSALDEHNARLTAMIAKQEEANDE